MVRNQRIFKFDFICGMTKIEKILSYCKQIVKKVYPLGGIILSRWKWNRVSSKYILVIWV